MPGLVTPDRPPAVEPGNGLATRGLPLKPVSDSSVWKASDFKDDSWIASLSEQHIQEIEAAIDATIHAHEDRFGRSAWSTCPFLLYLLACLRLPTTCTGPLGLPVSTRWRGHAQLTSQSCRIESIRKEDVQLPTLGPLLAEVQSEVVFGRGFALLRGLPVQRWSLRCVWHGGRCASCVIMQTCLVRPPPSQCVTPFADLSSLPRFM